ncbi:ATP-binding domain-containing protein [Arsukibacterium sp.]|uniref:ATP-binding domain-containing protein n=1 Tax=Arsukibacterium sp. TaxID=1977258 RepID=UPI00299DF8CE|nr:ATP-binding domain-containing protein [Arsukibacterium sp.]MDX1539596.1 ATP-binding domain-containing protein [Arsukibacterium sp.]
MSDTWWKDEDDLVAEQAKVLDLDEEKSLLIMGPPGSGKTNLLLLRANQLYLGDYPNLHIVVFGSLLKHFIQLGGNQYDFPTEKIVTHAQLFNDILRSEGMGVDSENLQINEARVERANRLQELVDSGRVGKQFEALLLDEAQDYTPQEIRLMKCLTDVLIATADSRQKIYNVDDCIEVLRNCTDEIYPLTFHFRNGLAICRVADGIFKNAPDYTPLRTHSNYREADYPSTFMPKRGLSLEEQISAMVTQINDQRFAYPNDLIGILCPRNEELDIIFSALTRAGLGYSITRANSKDFDPSRPIWLSTLTAAKGLEFRALHIAGLDYLYRMGGVQKRLIYTGITRAKTALTMYWHNSIPGYLESAIQSASPSKAPVTKKKIFGKD